MKLFDIPYEAPSPQGWIVMGGDARSQWFTTRNAAIGHAMLVASQVGRHCVEQVFLCVEGGDGVWRLFNADLSPAT